MQRVIDDIYISWRNADCFLTFYSSNTRLTIINLKLPNIEIIYVFILYEF